MSWLFECQKPSISAFCCCTSYIAHFVEPGLFYSSLPKLWNWWLLCVTTFRFENYSRKETERWETCFVTTVDHHPTCLCQSPRWEIRRWLSGGIIGSFSLKLKLWISFSCHWLWLVHLQRMFMDTKLNAMQHSVATLEKLCRRYHVYKDQNPLILTRWDRFYFVWCCW